MIAFDFVFERPVNPEAAYKLWSQAVEAGKKPLYFSGGTEVVTAMRKGTVKADVVIDLKGIEAYKTLGIGNSPVSVDALWIGGGLALGALEEALPGTLLSEVARGIADHTVRGTLTIGGNICGRLAYREMALGLLTLGAEVVLYGPEGLVKRPMAEVFHKRLELKAGEFLLGFELEPAALAETRYFRRRRQKQTDIDYPICHTVVTRRGDAYSVAVSGVSAYVWYGEKTSARLEAEASPEARAMVIWERLSELAVDDLRASKVYKLGLLKRDLVEAFSKLGDPVETGAGKGTGVRIEDLARLEGRLLETEAKAGKSSAAACYSGLTEISVSINGKLRTLAVRPSETLLNVLRQAAGHTGAKPGCENGDCGACTVLLEGRPVKSCLMLAVEAEGRAVMTVEGLENTAIQQAFIECGGFQCGYCTSGFLVNAWAMLEAHPEADEAVQREWLSANLCRCTGYEGIRDAVERAKANRRA
ncbi:2Fe-2S iron-sulfur cluster-binding protein [Acidaminobacter sp.]|uniref:2Fe-2S iron-sulfur cluster-binding protein n=1 Tax=Acidaminobacter sp. TaxID=1872102 RepID=UPI002F41A3DF